MNLRWLARVRGNARPAALGALVLALVLVGGVVLNRATRPEPPKVDIAEPTSSPPDVDQSPAHMEEHAAETGSEAKAIGGEPEADQAPVQADPIPQAYVPPPIGGEGQTYVSFITRDALVEEDTNDLYDVYRQGGPGRDVLVSVSDSEQISNAHSETSARATSRDGRYVAFWSGATNLTKEHRPGLFVRDLLEGTTILVRPTYNGEETGGPATPTIETALSGDGRHIAFAGFSSSDSGSVIFVHHLDQAVTEIGAKTSAGETVTEFGRWFWPSYTGRYLLFTARGQDVSENPCGLSDCGEQVYRRDLKEGVTELVSVAPDGRQGNAASLEDVYLSDNERLAYFRSCATNLIDEKAVPPSTTACSYDDAHQFVRDLTTKTTTQIP